MPRQDVPYGGAICRLKERIAEIWDELGKKLHSINGVEGDAAGDVKIVSGDAAVVITSDQVNHQIEVALDSSQLPAAAVASVNGQTGAVALDAGDIPSDGNSDVQTDIDVNKTAISACSSAITSEQLARQNADATLQTNINTLSASLPSAAAAAVAADPTVAQLVTDMAGKVDLTDVSTVETPDTIAKRNGSGRLVAADPASGATDKTLTTANWISQTGSGAPNNLLHRTGNESKTGQLTFESATGDLLRIKSTHASFAEGVGSSYVPVIIMKTQDLNNTTVYNDVIYTSSGNNRTHRQQLVHKAMNGTDTYEIILDLSVTDSGTTTYRIIKLKNGAQIGTVTLASL